jgi:hypothetical protein
MSVFDNIMIDQQDELDAIEHKASIVSFLASELQAQCQRYRTKYGPFRETTTDTVDLSYDNDLSSK